ncbi:unnamed protein product [Cylindrotheca closterium]|uniref:Uncharacterized protein n=1 Tax=Cylindrotheca closterium TaxID=2856 RepID=A0AAD2G9Y4_9STRA|nr:unnamed protein product [Cylindrotheca closterium]
MDTINDGIRFLNSSIDACTDYVRENAIQLIIIGALVYYLKNRKQQDQGYTLSQSRPTAAATTTTTTESAAASETTSTKNKLTRDEHLMAVRERQQQLANQRALEAAKLRKEKQQNEKDRKNQVAQNKKKKGDVLGNGSASASTSPSASASGASCAYNPMQPWSGHSNGFRFVTTTATHAFGI